MFAHSIGNEQERRLTKLFRGLTREDQGAVIAFTEFLAARQPAIVQAPVPRSPNDEPRPEQETVIAAIKRLARTYDMLDRSAMLHETSSLVTAHVMHGRPASAVIDELESLFAGHYESYRTNYDVPPSAPAAPEVS